MKLRTAIGIGTVLLLSAMVLPPAAEAQIIIVGAGTAKGSGKSTHASLCDLQKEPVECAVSEGGATFQFEFSSFGKGAFGSFKLNDPHLGVTVQGDDMAGLIFAGINVVDVTGPCTISDPSAVNVPGTCTVNAQDRGEPGTNDFVKIGWSAKGRSGVACCTPLSGGVQIEASGLVK